MHFAETLARKQSEIPTEGINKEEQKREEKEIQQSTKTKRAASQSQPRQMNKHKSRQEESSGLGNPPAEKRKSLPGDFFYPRTIMSTASTLA